MVVGVVDVIVIDKYFSLCTKQLKIWQRYRTNNGIWTSLLCRFRFLVSTLSSCSWKKAGNVYIDELSPFSFMALFVAYVWDPVLTWKISLYSSSQLPFSLFTFLNFSSFTTLGHSWSNESKTNMSLLSSCSGCSKFWRF